MRLTSINAKRKHKSGIEAIITTAACYFPEHGALLWKSASQENYELSLLLCLLSVQTNIAILTREK